MARRLLFFLLCLQALTHLFWLSPAAHSGQVAIPWLMRQGKTLFGDIFEQHAPGSSWLGAAAQGLLPAMDPALLVKLLNTLLVLVLTLLIYALAKRLTEQVWAGALAAAVWVWWEPVYGNIMLYFDTLLAFCLLAALLIYFWRDTGPSTRQVILSGLLLGLATLCKQQAWLAVIFMGTWLLLTTRRRQTALLYGAAVLALPALQWACLYFAGPEIWQNYVYWNWTFNLSGHMDSLPLDGDFLRKLLLSNLLVFPFALLVWRRQRRHLPLLLLWLAGLILLYPRPGEIHAMGHLPFTAVMSGIVLAKLLPQLLKYRDWDLPQLTLAGLALGIGLGWLWTGAVSYIPLELGIGKILAYDEFEELADKLKVESEAGDTLFVLPETDSTPQLHPLTDMPPPGLWIKGWRWYLRDEVLETLLTEWKDAPPTWVVVFADLIPAGQPAIDDLLQFVEDDGRYAPFPLAGITPIFGHGPPTVYRSLAGHE